MHDPLLRTGRKRREQRETERKTEKDGEIEKNRERAQKKRNTEEPREKCRPWKRGTEERRGRRDADLFCFATFSPEPREPIKMPSSSTAPVCYLFRVPFLFPLRPFRFRENFSPSAPSPPPPLPPRRPWPPASRVKGPGERDTGRRSGLRAPCPRGIVPLIKGNESRKDSVPRKAAVNALYRLLPLLPSVPPGTHFTLEFDG